MTELEKATSVYVDKKRLKFWNDARKSGCLVFPEFVCSDNDLEQAFKAGANWQYEQFEKERLKHCDELTAEQAQIESDFVVQHLKNFNRTPTFIDAIEKQLIDKSAEWLNNFYNEDRHCFLVKEDIDAFIKAMEE